MSQRFEGHNLEEALNNAATGLGVDRYKISHRVIVEKRGFLGGIKRVVIEADVNPDATEPAQPILETPISAPVRSARAPREGRAGGGRGRGRGERRDDFGNRGGRGDREGGRRDRGARGRSGGDALRPGDFEKFTGEIPEQGAETDAARDVRAWCEHVLELARIDAAVRSEENDEQILIRFYGADGPRLIERNGELLDSLQVLANKALVGRKTEKELEFDCQNFKQRRNEEIGQQAREVAERVRRDGREQLLQAMSPVERRIVHLTLRDDADVTTVSRGEGFYKRVAVLLRSEAEDSSES